MLRTAFIEKYDMLPYDDRKAPAVFSGIYFSHMLKKLIDHEGPAVAIWRGADISWALKVKPEYIEQIKAKKNITHIAPSSFIENTLKEANIPHTPLPVVARKNDDIKPCGLGNMVYAYNATSPKYGGGIFEQVRDKLKRFHFIVCNYKTYTREQLLNIYASCFIGVRFTDHDGLSNTVVEMGLMGRRVIWNGNTPNAIPWSRDDIGQIVKTVNMEYENREKFDYLAIAKQMEDYLNISDDFLYTEQY